MCLIQESKALCEIKYVTINPQPSPFKISQVSVTNHMAKLIGGFQFIQDKSQMHLPTLQSRND